MDPVLAARAGEAVCDVLSAVTSAPVTLVASPPGAGKTGLVERVAVQQAALRDEDVAIATTTPSQARELLCAAGLKRDHTGLVRAEGPAGRPAR
ncbi:MAG: hypothetical protein ACYCTE_08930 [Acidimicrobiales bacterium]